MGCSSRRSRVLPMVLALLIAGAVPRVARADRDKALALYERGTVAYNLRDFRAAITAYEAAYKEYPAPEFLFNIAQAYRQLDDCEQATHFYRRYLALRPDAEERQEVLGRIADLDARCRDRSRVRERPPDGTQAPAEAGTPKETTPHTRSAPSGETVHTATIAAAPAEPRRWFFVADAAGGITELAIGPASSVQATARVGLGVGLEEGALSIRLGPLAIWSRLPWVRGDASGELTHLGLLANVSLGYRAVRALSLRAELGGGASVLLGFDPNDGLRAPGSTRQSLALFALRAAIGADLELSPSLFVTLTPLALTFSPASDDLAPEVGSVRAVDAALGVGLRL